MTLNEREEVDLLLGPDGMKNDPQNLPQSIAEVWGKNLFKVENLNGKSNGKMNKL